MAGIKKELMMLINSKCNTCGIAFHVKQSQIDVGKGKYCSRKCYMVQRSKWMKDKKFNPSYRVNFKGNNNPNWKGGICRFPYPFDFDAELHELIRKRDHYKCVKCGCPQEEQEKKLTVHHIDENKNNNSEKNLITLCNSCHCLIHAPWRKEVANEYA